MILPERTYSVESVRAGHPDKVCDQISDAILDDCLRQDPQSRVAVESYGSHGLIVVGGEVTTAGWVDVHGLVKRILRDIGYDEHYGVISNIVEQSPEIATGVTAGGAGDQGVMYGYATSETEDYLPMGVTLVHEIVRRLDTLTRENKKTGLLPDGKAQVTVTNGRVSNIVVSAQHDSALSIADVRHLVEEEVLLPLGLDLAAVDVLVNPAGTFNRGGFDADTGLTGRKIMVDTYGGIVPHGGGSFSGKDATKVDRSAAYMARYAAKNIVANALAKECLVSVAYAIGSSEPVMLEAVNERGESISNLLREKFDFRPESIIERLGLRRPIYQPTAVYGHFGRTDVPWEEVVKF
ncbi:MAG: methionine adenosyltransferase [Patescibacteria group bacterium]